MDGKDSVMFSKKSDEWETPKSLYDKLNEEFQFTLDAAATLKNSLCAECFTKEMNALVLNWNYNPSNVVFLNPPYGQIGKFIQKAYKESQKGTTVVCLIPVRSDTRYWHEYCMKALEIRLIKGRLKFNNRQLPSYKEDMSPKLSPAPFPSCIVIFKKGIYIPTISSY